MTDEPKTPLSAGEPPESQGAPDASPPSGADEGPSAGGTAGAADGTPPAPSGGGKSPRRRSLVDVVIPRRWLWGVLAGLVVIIVVSVVAFGVATRTSTCGTCHLLAPEVASYKTSPHAKAGVGCLSCHTKPGAFRYFIENLQGVANLITYISGNYRKPLSTTVSTESCVQCHPASQIDKNVVVNGIIVNHIGLRQAGFQCVTCHDGVAHGTTGAFGSRPTVNVMSVCVTCHNGVNQPETCSICHVNGVPPGSVHIAMNTHLTATNCQSCHSTSFCSKCHNGVQMPHPAVWSSTHGVYALQHGQTVCVKCHQAEDPTFCSSCHGLAMPHPATWLATGHEKAGAATPSLCVKCHGTNSCLRCHGLPMPHPSNWLAQHGQVALTNAGLCSKCHSSSFCSDCHGVVLPHPASFIANHPAEVMSNGAICVKCHGNAGSGPTGCYGGSCHHDGVTSAP
jgi:hypothetical protein